jgi:hypothetical protein
MPEGPLFSTFLTEELVWQLCTIYHKPVKTYPE